MKVTVRFSDSSIQKPFEKRTVLLRLFQYSLKKIVGIKFAYTKNMILRFTLILLLFLSNNPLWAAAWSQEPTVQETQEAALRYLGSDPRELESLKRKARWAAALPRLQFDYDRDQRESFALSTQDTISVTGGDVFIGPDDNDLSRDFNDTTGIGIKAVWSLNELVFNRDLLAVGVEQRNWSRERSLVASEVAQIYFERRKLQMLGGPTAEERLKVKEYAARLDALTGGWFSRQLK
ncbi:MAG: hypothetical protein Q7S00_05510 [bacterium]|nr:hypothetical protein [bacterium]